MAEFNCFIPGVSVKWNCDSVTRIVIDQSQRYSFDTFFIIMTFPAYEIRSLKAISKEILKKKVSKE